MLNSAFFEKINQVTLGFQVEAQESFNELNLVCSPDHLKSLMLFLKNHESCRFDTLIDVCAVDYLHYGRYDWETSSATEYGYCRGVENQAEPMVTLDTPRFAVIYHLLSTTLNQRCRVKVYLPESDLRIPTVIDIWNAANWFEREAYDLYGVLFEDHPDLRRLLTDYGFIGHPFRKDFPLSGRVEMRYDATLKRVVYEPVNIEPRVLVPKVIREDNRYIGEKGER
ncbi:MAG: NADH-quinone oxidoreductase subunit [Pseudomonadota bacterium]|nr:NADH-quinone oxidoreductase subunit [Pseudomonadota bacterium]